MIVDLDSDLSRDLQAHLCLDLLLHPWSMHSIFSLFFCEISCIFETRNIVPSQSNLRQAVHDSALQLFSHILFDFLDPHV